MTTAHRVRQILRLRSLPVAIGFAETLPPGLPRWNGGAMPAGCAFWAKAGETSSFYTEAVEHYACPIGCHTHNIALPEERQAELMQTLSAMVAANYLDMSEVPSIPVLPRPTKFVVYGPADGADFAADVILLAARPAQVMLVYEAAIKAGAGGAVLAAIGRPACSVLPAVVHSQSVSVSFACTGNRTFTGLPDDEMYVCVPAGKWPAVAEKIIEANVANEAMGKLYGDKQKQFV